MNQAPKSSEKTIIEQSKPFRKKPEKTIAEKIQSEQTGAESS